MPIYVSMLRGINVGPHKRMRMDSLRESFESLGFEQVQTYIQSGNIVFKTGRVSPAAIAKKIEAKLLDDFGFSVPSVCRTADEIAAVVRNNPFLKRRGVDTELLHVMFLSDVPSPAALSKLAALTEAPEEALCMGKEVYLHLPRGVAESRLMKAPLDRVLSLLSTTRNWKTVNQLARMCEDCR